MTHRWTEQDCAELRAMKLAGERSNAEIAAHFGVSIHAIQVKWTYLRSPEEKAAAKAARRQGTKAVRHNWGPNTQWTVPRRAKLARLYDAAKRTKRFSWPEIAAAMNSSVASCQQTMYYIRKERGQATTYHLAVDSPPPPVSPRRPLPPPPPQPATAAPILSRHVGAARLAMMAEIGARIALQGATAGLMGDPPPGRSALDQRRGGGAP